MVITFRLSVLFRYSIMAAKVVDLPVPVGPVTKNITHGLRHKAAQIFGRPIYSKDIILHIIGDMGANGCTYNSVEFYGDTIKHFSLDARLTITNMVVEMGAKFGVMEYDDKVERFLRQAAKVRPKGALRNKATNVRTKIESVKSDKDAFYIKAKRYNASGLEPMIAKPHTVDNVSTIGKIRNIRDIR